MGTPQEGMIPHTGQGNAGTNLPSLLRTCSRSSRSGTPCFGRRGTTAGTALKQTSPTQQSRMPQPSREPHVVEPYHDSCPLIHVRERVTVATHTPATITAAKHNKHNTSDDQRMMADYATAVTWARQAAIAGLPPHYPSPPPTGTHKQTSSVFACRAEAAKHTQTTALPALRTISKKDKGAVPRTWQGCEPTQPPGGSLFGTLGQWLHVDPRHPHPGPCPARTHPALGPGGDPGSPGHAATPPTPPRIWTTFCFRKSQRRIGPGQRTHDDGAGFVKRMRIVSVSRVVWFNGRVWRICEQALQYIFFTHVDFLEQ
jgi:hypothetical protein